MRIRVLPGSLWLAYTMTDVPSIQEMLPPSLRVASVPALHQDRLWPSSTAPQLLYNVYDVDAPWMRGTRMEIVTMARHRRTGQVHFCVLDCYTDCMQWDPERGVRGPNARVRRRGGTGLRLDAGRAAGKVDVDLAARAPRLASPSSTFVVDANRACYYGGMDIPFPLSFDPAEVRRPVEVFAPSAVVRNDVWKERRAAVPSQVFRHPHEMRYEVGGVTF